MALAKEKIKRSIERSDKLKNGKSGEFESIHKLPFEIGGEYLAPDVMRFRIGTCTGIYSCEGDKFIIIGIVNHEEGNGHLQDVFDWFENSCKRDKRSLMVAEIMNEGFYKHLIEKRGFTAIDKNNVIKNFK
jgi:hypothetical protein